MPVPAQDRPRLCSTGSLYLYHPRYVEVSSRRRTAYHLDPGIGWKELLRVSTWQSADMYGLVRGFLGQPTRKTSPCESWERKNELSRSISCPCEFAPVSEWIRNCR